MSRDEQRSCGIQKLTPKEKEKLLLKFVDVFSKGTQSTDCTLAASAQSYLESQGWEVATVLGTRKIKTTSGTGTYLVAEKGVWTYVLEPKLFSMLKPGKYLAKMGFSSCEFIDHDGETREFWTEDTR